MEFRWKPSGPSKFHFFLLRTFFFLRHSRISSLSLTGANAFKIVMNVSYKWNFCSVCLHTQSGGESCWCHQGWLYHLCSRNCSIIPGRWMMTTEYRMSSHMKYDNILKKKVLSWLYHRELLHTHTCVCVFFLRYILVFSVFL